jgi:hypothetical protein
MASEAQVQANRANAQKSTGPRTPEGKAVVAQNAVRHGLAARLEVIRGEDQAEFDRHREEMLAELAPVGARESMLAERVVGLSWRLQRAGRLQNEVFDALLGDQSSPLARSLLPEGTTRGQGESEAEAELTRGRVVLEDFSHGRVLDRLLLYERRIERSFYNAMRELRDLQRLPETARVPVGATPPAGRAGGGAAVRDARSRGSQELGGRPLQVRDGLSDARSGVAAEVAGGPFQMREALSAMRARIAEEVDRGMPAGALLAPRGLSWGTDAEVAASLQRMMDELCRTNPTSRLRIADCGLRIERSPAGTSNPFDYRSGQAPQGAEMRRTKPIGAEPERGQVAGAQGVAADARESACRETKPISAESGAEVDSAPVSEGVLLCEAMGR